HVS
ncbi:fatty acid cis/trans isomerase domain protein, partial [Vibrio parahaemolyticus V-223/04]